MFHAAGFAIHLLLIAAIISVIVHFREWRAHANCLDNHPPDRRFDGRRGLMPGLEISARAFLSSLRF
jgi:hypothetical protein